MAGRNRDDDGRREAELKVGSDENVLRFPGDWFGSTDALVPLRLVGDDGDCGGPVADLGSRRPSVSLQPAGVVTAEPSISRSGSPVLIDGDAFWGEDSGSVQQTIDRPIAAPAPLTPVKAVRSGRRPRRPLLVSVTVAACAVLLALGIGLRLGPSSGNRSTSTTGSADHARVAHGKSALSASSALSSRALTGEAGVMANGAEYLSASRSAMPRAQTRARARSSDSATRAVQTATGKARQAGRAAAKTTATKATGETSSEDSSDAARPSASGQDSAAESTGSARRTTGGAGAEPVASGSVGGLPSPATGTAP